MDIVSLIINLLSGAAGGNIAGAAMPNQNLGGIWNTVIGILGGGLGSTLLQTLGVTNPATLTDISSILANIGTSGVSGAVLLIIVSLIKNGISKKV